MFFVILVPLVVIGIPVIILMMVIFNTMIPKRISPVTNIPEEEALEVATN